jgi:hypothetical protein
MPRTCTVCRHQNRNDIDLALIRPDSLRDIALRYGTSKSALERHRDKCLPKHLLRAKEDSEIRSAAALVNELRELASKTGEILTRAMREKNGDLALKAIARLERQLELKARLLDELEERAPGVQHIEVTYVDKASSCRRRRDLTGLPGRIRRVYLIHKINNLALSVDKA